MFSRILIKLIDQAILPAIVLLVTRVLSVLLLAKSFETAVSIETSGFVFANQSDYILINSYSIFVMLMVLTVGIMFVLLKSFIFHDTHIAPHMTAKLFSLRLSSFIQTSFDLFSQGAVWLSYIYLLTIVTAILVYVGIIFSWVLIVAVVLTLLSTVLLAFDIENELSIRNGPFDGFVEVEEDFVLTLEDVPVSRGGFGA